MMANDIVMDFEQYIWKSNSTYSDWYVGITGLLNQRLFSDHKVSEQGLWRHALADRNEIAREIEKYFLSKGCDGGPGGGDSTSKTVYIYLKTRITQP